MASLSNAQTSVDATATADVARDEPATAGEDNDADDKEYECYNVIEQVVRVGWSDKI